MPSAPLMIYIAGPYSAAEEDLRRRNVDIAIDAALALFSKGHLPYVPHLTHFIDCRAKEIGVRLTWEDYIRWDVAWLGVCQALLFLGSSKGADFELRAARDMGKKIFYSVAEVPIVSKGNP